LYSEYADTIEAVFGYIRRSQRLTADAGDEFSSWARLKLLENDCAILRKFQGLSSLRTFLVTVINRLFLDWRITEWGRWRPTADARRLGALAIELERLIVRDHLDFQQAANLLVSKGVADSHEECDRVWGELPQRPGRRRAAEDALDNVPAPSASRDQVAVDEEQANASRTGSALAGALPQLSPEEQLIIRLRYQDGFTVARIAQLLGQEQKPLYRRIEQILGRLRVQMTSAGVTADEVRALLGNPVVELGEVFPAAEMGNLKVGPSTPTNAGGGV
jgi:RNA polymerase sigma factor for flagellar operon FliA